MTDPRWMDHPDRPSDCPYPFEMRDGHFLLAHRTSDGDWAPYELLPIVVDGVEFLIDPELLGDPASQQELKDDAVMLKRLATGVVCDGRCSSAWCSDERECERHQRLASSNPS